MAIDVFDMTAFTQFSIRRNTGIHPDGYSLGVYMGGAELHLDEVNELKEQGKPVPPEFHCYDAVDWERAVKLAEWILENDKIIKTAQRHQESLNALAER